MFISVYFSKSFGFYVWPNSPFKTFLKLLKPCAIQSLGIISLNHTHIETFLVVYESVRRLSVSAFKTS